MTITMAKRLPATAMHAPVALLALLLAPNCLADWKLTPTIDLRQTYTDNVNLRPEPLALSQNITELTPGLSLLANSPRLKLNARYDRHFYRFSDETVPNKQNAVAGLNANMKATLVDELLFFDATGSIGQHTVSAFGPQATDNSYSGANKAEVKTWRISPYMQHRFGTFAVFNGRLTHDSVKSGTSGLGNTEGDALSLSLASVQGRRFGWSTSLSRQHLQDTRAPASTSDNAALTLSYALGSNFKLNSTLGYDRYDYQALGGKTAGKSWNGGFEWTPSQRTSLSATAGRRYYGSSYSLHALHRSRHTVWSINYDDQVTTTRAQFLLPASIDTASMLDRLFTPTFPDAAERAQAVQAYIKATGLPASLADNINYFSNRYILQKQAQASVAFNSARTTTVLTYADTRRNALSNIQTDSPLQGSASANLNDNVHQKSASALWSLRISPKSTMALSLTANDSVSNSTGLSTDYRAVRASMTRQFMSRLRGELELRRVTGSQVSVAGDYRENAISASLNMQF